MSGLNLHGYDKALIGGVILSFLFGGWNHLATAAVVFVILDYFTGVGAAVVEAKTGKGEGLSSTVGLVGFIKKLFMLTMPVVGHFLDLALDTNTLIRDTFLYGIILNELLSLIENWGRMGLPTIPFLDSVIAVLRNKTQAKTGGDADGAA